MKRIFTAALIVLSAAFFTLSGNNAYAALCSRTTALASLNISDDITLNPAKKGVVGTVLWSKSYPVPDVSYKCDGSTQSTWHSTFTRSYVVSQVQNIYATEIPGIGIRVRWPGQTSSSWIPGNSGSPTTCSTGCSVLNSTVLVEFVQIGNLSEGESYIPAGTVAQASVIPTADTSEKLPIMEVSFGAAIKVVPLSCSIYPTSNHIDLGTYSIADFQNNGTKQGDKKEFSITIGCPSTLEVGLTFNSVNNIPFGTLSGIIGVEKGEGYAGNFAIRLYEKASAYNISPVKIGSVDKFTASPTITKKYQAQIYVEDGVERKNLTPGKVVGAVIYTMVTY